MSHITKSPAVKIPGSTPVLEVEIQRALEESDLEEPPGNSALIDWARAACESAFSQSLPGVEAAELTIRLVDGAEMLAFNTDYRGKNRLTNVLSFSTVRQPEMELALGFVPLGDIVICHPVVVEEARQQQINYRHHYAHMVIHGVLHLCGYDHENEADARRMESLEAELLQAVGIPNPYAQ